MDKKDKIRIVQDIVKIPTVNDNEEKVADYFEKLFSQYHITSKKVMYSPGRANLVAEIGKGKGKILALSGHMDVVSPGDEKEWKYPPFSGTITDNKLYGRGSTDMKAGTAALAIAMIELMEEKKELNGTVRFLATVGEEIGELGAEQLTKEGYVSDINALLIAEPTNYILVYTHKGSINYTVTSKGKPAHSSMPEQGINSLDPLVAFYTKVNEEMNRFINSTYNEELGKMIHNITVFNGGDQVNSIPGFSSLQGNIRTIPETPNEEVIKKLKEVAETINASSPCEVSITIDYDKHPVDSDSNSRLIQVAKSVTKNLLNKDLKTIGISGTTDGAEFMKSGASFDFVIYGPGEPQLPHQYNEYVNLDNYLEMIDIYKEIIQEYLK